MIKLLLHPGIAAWTTTNFSEQHQYPLIVKGKAPTQVHKRTLSQSHASEEK